MGKIVLILWIAAIAFGGFWLVYYQEGANRDITIEFEGKGRVPGIPFSLDSGAVYITSTRFALVGKGPGQDTGKVIIDMKEKKFWMVIDKSRVVVTMALELVDTSECEPAKFAVGAGEDSERLPDSKAIAGFRCHAFKSEKGRETTVAWYTYELPPGRDHVSLINKVARIKLADMPSGAGLVGGSGEKRPQVSSFEYFPIPLLLAARTRQGNVRLEAKSIKYGTVDDDVFKTPSGYKEVDFGEFLKTLGGGGR